MKAIIILLLATFTGMSACSYKRANTNTISGVVSSVIGNTVTIVVQDKQTYSFNVDAIEECDKLCDLYTGDSVKIAYNLSPVSSGPVTASSVKLEGRTLKNYAIGEWTEPINGQSGVQGFELFDNGSARSINMATLQVLAWKCQDKELTMKITSIGNKEIFTSDKTYEIVKADADSLILSENGRVVWRLSRK